MQKHFWVPASGMQHARFPSCLIILKRNLTSRSIPNHSSHVIHGEMMWTPPVILDKRVSSILSKLSCNTLHSLCSCQLPVQRFSCKPAESVLPHKKSASLISASLLFSSCISSSTNSFCPPVCLLCSLKTPKEWSDDRGAMCAVCARVCVPMLGLTVELTVTAL